MPSKCKPQTLEQVISYFDKEIDGMGNRDGHPGNVGIPQSISQFQKWQLCDLPQDEFMLTGRKLYK